MIDNEKLQLIEKYNIGAPRYTSYPTVPYWEQENWSESKWLREVENTFRTKGAESGIALYIHLPFCESLCTYCGCNTRITKNHKVEIPYLESIIKEWKLYKEKLGSEKIPIEEIHLGGGTPTFFSAENLRFLIVSLLEDMDMQPSSIFSFEAHPANTTFEHLETLYNLGFKRLSLGIQDFDPHVQKVINRYQTKDDVRRVMDQARSIGYTSINFDLVYGLPLQTLESLTETVDISLSLKPDRISFYSYAHVPWVKPGQRMFTELDLPDATQKLRLYYSAKEMIQAAGYHDVGMDHFALPSDDLYRSAINKKLHRNFMGYTDRYTPLLIGLGVSSISDAWGAFAQNEKKVEIYRERVGRGELPQIKGHILNEEDKIIRAYILEMMCQGETTLIADHKLNTSILKDLEGVVADGLVEIDELNIKVLPKGHSFLRNICMAFDQKLKERQPDMPTFSKAI